MKESCSIATIIRVCLFSYQTPRGFRGASGGVHTVRHYENSGRKSKKKKSEAFISS